MKTHLILITGACGSGKSHFAGLLKKEITNLPVVVHDFDEKIDLSLDEGILYFLNKALEYKLKGKTLILCGGVTPEEIKRSTVFSDLFVLHSCLLDVSSEERERRILDRDDTFFKLINKEGIPKEEFIRCIISSGENYKSEIKISDTYIVVDNTSIGDNSSYVSVISWIRSIVGEEI